MLGAIIGDIVGSRFEFVAFKSKKFELFHPSCNYTDDSICCMATAAWLLECGEMSPEQYAAILQKICRQYPHPMGGYGGSFAKWVKSDAPAPYGSYGNGSAMRVAPVGWAFDSLNETLEMARRSASVTHNHPEGIKGAQAVAAAIYFARKGYRKPAIMKELEELTGYVLNKTCDEIRPDYHFNETCQGTVPEAIIAFLDSTDFEDAIRQAISLGGDSDTLTCITGAIAEAYYGIPTAIAEKALSYLPPSFRELYSEFSSRYLLPKTLNVPTTDIDLTPEYKEKSANLALAKDLYLTFLLEYNDLQSVVKPNLTSLYLIRIGERQLRLLEYTARVAALKYKMQLLQAALNRNEKADMAAIERDIAQKMADYTQQIDQQAAQIEQAQRHFAGMMSTEESAELRKIYYALAKKLHPDINPQQSEKDKTLWLIVSNGYAVSDLETLRGIYLGMGDASACSEMVYSDIDVLEQQLKLYNERVADVLEKTKALKSSFPFTYEERLQDDVWVAGEVKRLDEEIAVQKENIGKLEQYITLIIESLP